MEETKRLLAAANETVAETAAIGARLNAQFEQIRRRARMAMTAIVVVVIVVVGILVYVVISESDTVSAIRTSQVDNRHTAVETLAAVRIEYEVACGVAEHYGVKCPPFPKAK